MAQSHRPDSQPYELLTEIAARAVGELPLKSTSNEPFTVDGFGTLTFPFHKMGAIDTTHLFGLDELIIYSFYLRRKGSVSKAADLGANLGLHSLMMARLGFQVTSYEPDPVHFDLLTRNVKLNGLESAIRPVKAAVSSDSGTMEFIRVKGNTTSSHLAGAKSDPYGELEKFPVDVVGIREVMKGMDFVKMDVEGQESKIIAATQSEDWRSCEMMLEIGSPENAASIFSHLPRLGLSAFVQKEAWQRAKAVSDLPTSYREGSVFLTAQSEMTW